MLLLYVSFQTFFSKYESVTISHLPDVSEPLTVTIINVTVNSSIKLTMEGLNIHISQSNVDSLYIILHNNQSLHKLVENPKIFIHNSSFGKLDLLAGTEALVTHCYIDRDFVTRSTLISSYASSVTIANCSFHNFKTREGPTVLHARVNSTVTLTNTTVVAHQSPHGAILIHNNCSVRMQKVSISHHKAAGYGFPAAIFSDRVEALIYESVFTFNSAVFGGVFVASHSTVFECNGCVFDGNQAELGGVILIQYSSKLVLTYSAILNNRGISHNKHNSPISELNKRHSEILLSLVQDLEDSLHYGRGGTIHVVNSSSAQISRTTFRNNLANWGGAISVKNNSTLYIGRYSNFYGNMAEKGGAVWAGGAASVHVTGAHFHNNDAGNVGGAILGADQTAIIVNDSVLNENHASYGGALFLEGKNSTLVVNDVNFTRNDASKNGGAMLISGPVITKIDSCTFNSNRAGYGGAIDAANNATVHLRNSEFVRNKADFGGAVYATNTTLNVENSAFYENAADTGGCVYVIKYTELTILKSNFTNNEAHFSGGVIYMSNNVDVNVVDTLFMKNKAKHGGSIFGKSLISLQLDRCTFRENVAASGGAIAMKDNVVVQTKNSAFISNVGKTKGGAFWFMNKVTAYTYNCYFKDNTAVNGGCIAARHEVTMYDRECTFDRNYAKIRGGVIFGQNGFALYIETASFRDNLSKKDGGVLFIKYNSMLEIRMTNFTYNNAYHWGGTMLLAKGVDAEITSSGFYGNKADNGGAIDLTTHVQVHIAESSFLGNGAEENGGALSGVDSVSVILNNCNFVDNNATMGAAIELEQNSRMDISNCLFYKNHADEYAGAMMILAQTTTRIENSQFEENIAANGGVLYLEKSAVAIQYSSLNNNKGTKKFLVLFLLISSILELPICLISFFSPLTSKTHSTFP